MLIYLIFPMKNFLKNFFLLNNFYCDYYSFFLMILTLLIFMIFKEMKMKILSKINLWILAMFLFMVFMSLSFIQFYILFELSMIPILLIVFQSGKQKERIKSGFYLFFFTLTSSLPTILILVYFRFIFFLWNFNEENFEVKFKFLLLILLFMSFFVKLPIFFFHSWLLKAHVQAPVYGSMILASVLLKLGGFGLFKFLFYYYNSWLQFMMFYKMLILIGMIVSGAMCLYLTDLKIVIALSSVSHMSFMTLSMINLMFLNMKGSIIMMVSHGFSSALMFYFFDLYYKRIKTRSIFFSKSVFSFYMAFFLAIICMINFSIPPSLNFFSEIILTINVLSWLSWLISAIFIYMFISTLFSLLLLIFLKDKSKKEFFFNSDLCLSELMISLFLISMSFMFSLCMFKI
uniref:NADH-ubiquinone oxidoreductase chain 4 n=1 Tax=Liposcelis entomophila TaxID=550478 RepID=A0A096X709_9NEOP|nr:NADH dehydrogenase subunit 4 [Liposcelis entomophila]AHA47080.1 NADH dehydrogenase subunit 4 [Liposcelis entomophila]